MQTYIAKVISSYARNTGFHGSINVQKEILIYSGICRIVVRCGSLRWKVLTGKFTMYTKPRLNARSRVLEKLIVPQVVDRFPIFCGSNMFIAISTRDHFWLLSAARCIQLHSPMLFP
jgi:hypothetical protein